MTKAGAGRLIAEPELTPERLAKEIFTLLDQPTEIEALAKNARSLAHPQAAREIVDLIEEAASLPPRHGPRVSRDSGQPAS